MRISLALAPCLGLCGLLFASSDCKSAGLSGRNYRGDGLSFQVGEIPPSWQSLDMPPARLAFRDEGGGHTVLLHARCHHDGDDVPLFALTQHLFLMFTERENVTQGKETLDGRETLHTQLRAKLDGVPKMFEVFVLKKDSCVYDFVDIAEPASYEATRAPFRRFVQGFHTLEGEP